MKKKPFITYWHSDSWRNAKKERPKESGDYLVVTAVGLYLVLGFSKRHNAFNAYDCHTECRNAIEVDYWAEIPPRPQEVSNGVQNVKS